MAATRLLVGQPDRMVDGATGLRPSTLPDRTTDGPIERQAARSDGGRLDPWTARSVGKPSSFALEVLCSSTSTSILLASQI